MKKIITLLLISSLGVLPQVSAMTLVPVADTAEAQVASIRYSILNNKDQTSNTFLTHEAVTLQFNIDVRSDDIGQSGSLFLVVQYKDRWYSRTETGRWQNWNLQASTLQPYQHKTLGKNEIIRFVDKQTLPAGEFLLYAGYQTQAGGPLFYNHEPASLVVFDQGTAALHRVKNKALLASFMARGSQPDFPLGLVTAAAASDSASGTVAEPVSQTNLQEAGVDEGDRIKTDGEHLYTLESCDADPQKQCITAYALRSVPASNTQLGQLDMDVFAGQSASLYLSQINNNQHLIHLSDSLATPIFDVWTQPYYWQANHSEIKFVNVSQASSMRTRTHISLDASVVSSRLINGVLYLVTRKNAYFGFPNLAAVSFAGDVVGQTLATDPQRPQEAPENLTIDDLLPTISFNDGTGEQALVQASDCYIPSQNSLKPVDNTVVTITAIPLDNPKAHYSSCIAGSVDTFYMSTESLYLATSRYPYAVIGNDVIYQPGQFEMTTEIHKFSLGNGTLDYRGSGSIPGHLGWDANKQPFRMGEHKGVLKVATSKGDTWSGTSTTRVSVLEEAVNQQSLEEISFLDNLGKTGERLFAARFIGDRGYLVTFRTIDPLYVLDFSKPRQPEVLGELEVNGYSDYLHPIGENYLLGIGKDAVPDANGERGAWSQGVKLSLFDVSDGKNLREVESQVIGKRGTESAILHDHHALAWLPSGDSATLAIPVQLHDQQTTDLAGTQQDFSRPDAYYGWSHTGLYTFNINTGTNPGIQLQKRLITDQPGDGDCDGQHDFCFDSGASTLGDRAVIQGETVHYIHNNSVFSSAITAALK